MDLTGILALLRVSGVESLPLDRRTMSELRGLVGDVDNALRVASVHGLIDVSEEDVVLIVITPHVARVILDEMCREDVEEIRASIDSLVRYAKMKA